MKNILKSKIVLLLIIALSLVLVGCKGGEGPGEKDNFNEANYELTTTPTFEKTLTSSEAKAELAKAVASLATTKSYSYTQKLTGEWDSQYTYEGVTKIDVSGASPMASIELTGTTNYAFYIANNKAYLNYNGLGCKTNYEKAFKYYNKIISENKIYDKLQSGGRVIFWNMQNTRKFTNKFNYLNISIKNDLAFYYKDILLYQKD
mgnify:CR=1 FL=1